MAFKLVDSLIGTAETVCKNRRSFLLKSRSLYLLERARFYSKNDENNSTDSSRESKLKELLNSSSPLKSSITDVDYDMWATTPYSQGTVFSDTEEEEFDEYEDVSDSASRSVILFPGQGNQFVGMGKNLLKYPVALDLFEAANKILKYDLSKICFEGPEHVLNDTKFCQPATFVCSLALLERLKDEKPWAVNNCVATCGYSLGELTALVFAGCMNFETGLKLVKFRAEVMAKSCKKTSGGMLTIFTGTRTKLPAAFSDAVEHCKKMGIENPVCKTASYLYPNCKVIAGNTEALDFLKENKKKYGIVRHSTLPVSGAFHTDLMKDAANYFKEELEKINISKPVVKVFSNVTGLPYKNIKQIKKLLPKQIFSPVLWEQTVHNIFPTRKGLTFPFLYECGPGSSLIATVKKVNNQASPNCFSVRM